MSILESHFDVTSGGAVVTTSAFFGYCVSESAFFPFCVGYLFGKLYFYKLNFNNKFAFVYIDFYVFKC